ncbi:class I mannose-6-phosphate isomerase [Microbacterium saperdae]|uniref:Mannose-6-phosphate isomerase n=1 Tax=Microbacterium saperdae TaxID=69368 RepID=A0A543BIW2_9MICO|nr:class I mannose-6-phosphate isomerase [Microbacterium saperdae]TQL84693.1 mannose-6-phosphate isomerase [Microbacterium saperdae]GGM64904.1 mannose-6-phosphate isomerase [Microbacterium saperdae]
MEPVLLSSNQPPGRFYRGGRRIADFRGDRTPPPNTPEDWVGSTTSVRGESPTGMTRLADGRLLSDVIRDSPSDWLGPAHVASYGDDTMLLVKLLDAGQRLPIHAHPDGTFAADHLSAAHGKAEAWYILTPGTVHLGLTRAVDAAELRQMVEAQDSSALLNLMHEIPVRPGDTVFVPTGVLHAIGSGILLVEVQEPEDLSILLEWDGFDLDGVRDGHLGLGFDVALTAVETRARTEDDIRALVRRDVSSGPTLASGAEHYFRLDRVDGRATFPAGFSLIVALEPAELEFASEARHSLRPGTTMLVPFAAGPFDLAGSALVARPPQV